MATKYYCRNEGKLILRAFFAHSPDASTVSFRYYLLGSNTAVSSGLSARLCHAFLVVYMLYSQLCNKYIDKSNRSSLGLSLSVGGLERRGCGKQYSVIYTTLLIAQFTDFKSRLSHTASRRDLSSHVSVRDKINLFLVRGPIDSFYLQAGLTDFDEIWHDGRS